MFRQGNLLLDAWGFGGLSVEIADALKRKEKGRRAFFYPKLDFFPSREL